MDYPKTDFNRVRDGREVPALTLVVDLSIARSRTAGTQMEIVAAGNSFYCDQDLENGGVSKITFQHRDYSNYTAPTTVSPGFTAYQPFTRFMLENAAQPGKFATFMYGVDTNFTPGQSGSVAITGSVTTTPVQGQTFIENGGAITTGNVSQVFLPADPDRIRFILRNTSSVNLLYVGGPLVGLGGAIRLDPGVMWVETDAASAEWRVIGAVAGSPFSYQELFK